MSTTTSAEPERHGIWGEVLQDWQHPAAMQLGLGETSWGRACFGHRQNEREFGQWTVKEQQGKPHPMANKLCLLFHPCSLGIGEGLKGYFCPHKCRLAVIPGRSHTLRTTVSLGMGQRRLWAARVTRTWRGRILPYKLIPSHSHPFPQTRESFWGARDITL